VLLALREWWFGLFVCVSALLHALVFLLFARADFVPPSQVPPQLGKASVRLLASADAQPDPAKKLREKPEPVVPPPPADDTPPAPLTEEPAQLPPSVVQPQPAPPAPRQAEPTPAARVQEEAPKPDKTKRPAKTSSVASQASEASEGAVDQLPSEQVNPAPPYPAEARAAGQEGTVCLRVKIDATGKVISASVSQSSGVESLDASALRTIYRWNFYPARRNGKAVPCEFLKPFEFSIRRS